MIQWLKKKLTLLREEIGSYSPRERSFIFFACLCGFFVCCEYSIIRPACNSLFIHAFSTKYFPYAWIAAVPLNLAMVSLYNRLVPKWGSKRVFLSLVIAVVGVNLTVASLFQSIPQLAFVLYIWKEVYVMLMFQLVWSIIHLNIEMSKARYLYGFFFGIGGLGSMLGSCFPSFFSVAFGTENIIFLSLPVYLMLTFVYLKMISYSKVDGPSEKERQSGGFLHGIKLIRSSRFLIFILLIVAFMQAMGAIADFQFNDFLERTIAEKDVRTEFSARVFGIIHTLSILLQFVGSYFIVRVLGLKRAHFLIPSVLVLSMGLFAVFPVFSMISFAFITIRALDFSIFGVIKEMLYVPLSSDEKFRAKSVIDVFAYRTSKALASFMILLVQAVFVETTHVLTYVAIAIALLWIGSVAYGMKEYEKVTRIPEAS